MEHSPRLVVLLALLRYMKPEEVERMKIDLAKLKAVTDRLLVDRFRKYLDIERLRTEPLVPEDIMVYNYLQYEFTGKFIKTKLLARYEREVMKGEIAAINELRSILRSMKIDL
ncbi:MAG: hypothetical protein JST38_09860 [Bacteroidetes bacterium]|nr:hypothetical protein [Bacteroidota bacterium]